MVAHHRNDPGGRHGPRVGAHAPHAFREAACRRDLPRRRLQDSGPDREARRRRPRAGGGGRRVRRNRRVRLGAVPRTVLPKPQPAPVRHLLPGRGRHLHHPLRLMALPRWFDDTFKVSVTLKGIDGALEVVGGAALLFVRPATLDHIARSLTQHELSQDPHDFIARHVLHSAGQLTHGSTLFVAVYLLSHGIAKVVLVVALLRDQLWAYPATIALLGAFIA